MARSNSKAQKLLPGNQAAAPQAKTKQNAGATPQLKSSKAEAQRKMTHPVTVMTKRKRTRKMKRKTMTEKKVMKRTRRAAKVKEKMRRRTIAATGRETTKRER